MTLDQFISRIRVASTVKELDWLATKLPSFGEQGEAAVVALLMDDSPRIFGNAGAVLGGAHYVDASHPITMQGLIRQLDHSRIEARQMALPVLINEMLFFDNDNALAALHTFYSASDANRMEVNQTVKELLPAPAGSIALKLVETGKRE